MAAVLKAKDDLRVRDPDGRGHRIMIAWAPYRRDARRLDVPDGARMGWSERLDVAKDAEPEWVVLVDRAIAKLVQINYFYERLIDRYYLDQQSLWQTAANLNRTPGFVMLSLNGLCSHVEQRVAYEPR